MTHFKFVIVSTGFCLLVLCLFVNATMAEKLAGPVAQWDFDTGEGDTIYDTSGHGLEAKMIDGRWVKQADGFALEMNGSTTFVDCGSSADMGITGPVTIEGWVKPTRKAFGE